MHSERKEALSDLRKISGCRIIYHLFKLISIYLKGQLQNMEPVHLAHTVRPNSKNVLKMITQMFKKGNLPLII